MPAEAPVVTAPITTPAVSTPASSGTPAVGEHVDTGQGTEQSTSEAIKSIKVSFDAEGEGEDFSLTDETPAAEPEFKFEQPKNPNFPNWGGRGVTVCDRWLGKGGFEKFYHDLGPRPRGKKNGRSLWSIHRKDGAMVYCPDTVKWADMTEQASNGRRNHWAIKREKS